jgi:hypothetical protein
MSNPTDNGVDVLAPALTAAQKLEVAQKAAAKARAEFIATLPHATPEQADACVHAARETQVSFAMSQLAEGLNVKFRLTEEQADQLAAARAEHKVKINTQAVRREAARYVLTSHLSSFKLKARKDGRMALSISGVLK